MNLKHFFSKAHKYQRPMVLWDLDASEEDIEKDRLLREQEYNRHKNFWNIYEETLEDLDFNYRHYIKYPITEFLDGMYNFWKYRKVIYKDRWWDYCFMADWFEAKLQDMHDNWDKSIYVDSEKEKEKLSELLGYLKTMKNYELTDKENEEAKDKFFKLLSEHYYYFWD